jgi:hypothetical protein
MDDIASDTNNIDDFKFKGAADAKAAKKAPDVCTICLDPISDRAVASPCNHLSFDFVCLVSWLQEQSTCPLCKAEVREVQYEWRSPQDFQTYNVPKTELRTGSSDSTVGTQYSRPQHRRPPVRRRQHTRTEAVGPSIDDLLERRRRVHRDQLYSLRVGANRISQYRDFTAQDFAASSELQSRTRMFLRRELKVFTFLDRNEGARNRDFLIEYVVALLKTNELRGADGRAEELLADFLGRDNTKLVLHELEAWLRSPYMTLDSWDRHVQYAERRQDKRRS